MPLELVHKPLIPCTMLGYSMHKTPSRSGCRIGRKANESESGTYS